ncbi:Triosephosphate isomerase, cytosolic, partial [Camellia lanceoleosa]
RHLITNLNVGVLPEVVVSPPYVFLPLVKDLLRPDFHIAAQNYWVKKGGAFTGEVSAEMLDNMSIPWVIPGHFERRALLNESNEFVRDKVAYALSQGLKVIACIGETLKQRESGSTMDVVTAQTKAISGTYFNVWTFIYDCWAPVVQDLGTIWECTSHKIALLCHMVVMLRKIVMARESMHGASPCVGDNDDGEPEGDDDVHMNDVRKSIRNELV